MIGSRLVFLRKQQGLVQEELAPKLGLPRTTYAGYESESREPDFKTLVKIADFHNTSLDFIFGRTDNQRPIDELSDEEYLLVSEMKNVKQGGNYNAK